MFNVAQVIKVYSGRKGCACGCRGKYTYASAFKCERPSYMTGDEGVSDRTVRMMVKKVEEIVREGHWWVARVTVTQDGYYFAVDMKNNRTYTIYFAEPKGAPSFMDTTG